jgi:hypothetical protein
MQQDWGGETGRLTRQRPAEALVREGWEVGTTQSNRQKGQEAEEGAEIQKTPLSGLK